MRERFKKVITPGVGFVALALVAGTACGISDRQREEECFEQVAGPRPDNILKRQFRDRIQAMSPDISKGSLKQAVNRFLQVAQTRWNSASDQCNEESSR